MQIALTFSLSSLLFAKHVGRLKAQYVIAVWQPPVWGKKKKRCPATDLISAVIRLTFDSHVRDLNIRFGVFFLFKMFLRNYNR